MSKNRGTRISNYHKWLAKCSRIAMEVEWCIEPDMDEWPKWYACGMTPEQAVAELFRLVREEYN